MQASRLHPPFSIGSSGRFGVGAAIGLGLGLLGSCNHTEPNPSGVYVSARPHVVTPDERGYAVAVPDGQALRSGQVFAIDLQLEQPAHVYVMHRRGGLVGSLYPGVGLRDKELSGSVRVPGPEAWMQVPQLDRQSRLCVLLSARPLAAEQRRCVEGPQNHGRPEVQRFELATGR